MLLLVALSSVIRLCTATTLTSWHLLVTFCSLHVALWMKLFEHKPFDAKAVMGFGILNGISIGLLNLSLGFNSVGFYQVKLILLNIPYYYMFNFWSFAISVFLKRVVSELMLYCLCIPDDKAGNHSLYCTLGDPFLQEEIQVNVETVFLWQCWYVDGHLHVYLIVITWPAVSLTYLAVIVILNWHGIACLRLGISNWVLKCMLAEFPDDSLHSHCF